MQSKSYITVNRDENQRSFVSTQWLLCQLNEIISLGVARPLQISDLGSLKDNQKTEHLQNKFQEHWEKNELPLPVEKRSVSRTILSITGHSKPLFAFLLSGFSAATAFTGPIVLKALIENFSGEHALSETQLWILICILLVVPILGSIALAKATAINNALGLVIKNSVSGTIFNKTLRINSSAKSKFTTGQIVNMFSMDVSYLQLSFIAINSNIWGPAQIAVALALIYQEVGVAMFVSFGFVIVLIPLLVVAGASFGSTIQARNLVRDKRIKLINEILNGIRMVKSYGWENAFTKQIDEIRETEVKAMSAIYCVWVSFEFLLSTIPCAIPVLIFFTYVGTGHQLTFAKAFSTLTLINLLQMPLYAFPNAASQMAQIAVSTGRLKSFLACKEKEDYVVTNGSVFDEHKEDVAVVFDKASLTWIVEDTSNGNAADAKDGNKADKKADDAKPKTDTETIKLEDKATSEEKVETAITLSDLSFTVQRGHLLAIVGGVGSGKSSVLSALLGEMSKLEGTVAVRGRIAYHQQQPWITNSTVKENILMGHDYDEAKFQQAVHAASLETDIESFLNGVDTEIGEKGINLSGGQKARISFARTIYADADVYLLDDPLSAVDAHVGKHIFHEGILKALKGKTVILVTHQTHFLPHCENILVLENGKMKGMGNYEQVKDIAHMIFTTGKHDSSSTTSNGENATDAMIDGELESDKGKTSNKKDDSNQKLIKEEERMVGVVDRGAYVHYIRAGGWLLFAIIVVIAICGKGCNVMSTFWLAYWNSQTLNKQEKGTDLSNNENLRYAGVFSGLLCMIALTNTLQAVFASLHGLSASRYLHFHLIRRVLKSPMSFFDTTPMGRILNRFSSDIGATDQGLAAMVSLYVSFLVDFLGSVAAISIATRGTFLILLVPVALIYYRLMVRFTRTNTELKRLDSISRSPIVSDFSETIAALPSIRAYKLGSKCATSMFQSVDVNSNTWILQQHCSQWLAIRLDVIGAVVAFFVAVLTATTTGFLSTGFFATALTYSFQLPKMMSYIVSMVSQVEATMSSVERVKFYSETLSQENDIEPEFVGTSVTAVATNSGDVEMTNSSVWPSKGQIEFKDVTMSYRDGPLVLKGINFIAKSGEKIGIVGRTGCGKSSLVSALLRITPISGGSILIDSVDTRAVSLADLRSKVTIVPQDPVLFSATVRVNLDPLNEHTDERMWEVLEAVEMKSAVVALNGGLNFVLDESGSNLSVGQRQLICIARAMLRQPKILILDEASASIDNQTDKLLQEAIRTKFASCTCLTIAHRLHTIMDSDRVLVLDAGKVIQDGPPHELTKLPGTFRDLWNEHNAK